MWDYFQNFRPEMAKFLCPDGRVIDASLINSGNSECSDGSDEMVKNFELVPTGGDDYDENDDAKILLLSSQTSQDSSQHGQTIPKMIELLLNSAQDDVSNICILVSFI